MTIQTIGLLSGLALVVGALLTNLLPTDLTALLAVGTLALTSYLTPEQAIDWPG